MSLNNELCITKPSLIDLNPVELSYYPFIVTLDRYNGSCNTIGDLSAKMYSKYTKRCKC